MFQVTAVPDMTERKTKQLHQHAVREAVFTLIAQWVVGGMDWKET